MPKPVTDFRFLYDVSTGVICARIYRGKDFEDANISPGALGNSVADGAKILCTVLQTTVRESA